MISDETPIRILYIGHIKHVQWGIFDGNIFRNALKKPSKPKNWLRNLWKKYVSEGVCWTNCTTLLIYQRSLTNQNVECAQSHLPIFVNRTIIHNEKRRSDPCRREGVTGQSRTPSLLFSQSCAFFSSDKKDAVPPGRCGGLTPGTLFFRKEENN